MRNEEIELHEGFLEAFRLMEQGSDHVFVTGRAGTGKSTLLNYFRAETKKKIAVLAPTGVAAVNVSGQTIHSFCRFRPDITVEQVKRLRLDDTQNIYRQLDAVVIDEISMVRADLLDCVDRFLRLNRNNRRQPFGGVQMILIGDLFQLPPVVQRDEAELFRTHYQSPYFFDAQVFQELNLELIELEKHFRQTDTEFLRLLEMIRTNRATETDFEALNARLDPAFVPSEAEFQITLTATNAVADEMNSERLIKLKGTERQFEGFLVGEFDQKALPTAPRLSLKKGAQVMLLNNDPEGRWVNGTMGKISGFKQRGTIDNVNVDLETGKRVEVAAYDWELFKLRLDPGTSELKSEVVGTFHQLPLKLAWAVTIHKSQGKTFEKVILDIGRGTFAHGQLYVALSRCRSLQGITLRQPLHGRHVLMDERVVAFFNRLAYRAAERKLPLMEKIAALERAIRAEQTIEITYLQGMGERVQRKIKPEKLGDVEHNGKTFLGLTAMDAEAGDSRVFRVERVVGIVD